MKPENITSPGTRYLALGALALTLASAPARADWVTVRADGSTQTTRHAPHRDDEERDDSYDGPGRLKESKKSDPLSIYDPPNIDNRMRVGSPNNSFEPGRVQIDSTYSYVPGYVPPGYVVPQYAYPPTVIYPPSNTTVVVPGPAYNVPIGPAPVVPNWANPNYNTQPYITSVPAGTTIYSSHAYPPYGYYPPPAYAYPAYPTYGYPAYGYPNGRRTTAYGSVTIGGRRGSSITIGGSNTTSTNTYSVRTGRR